MRAKERLFLRLLSFLGLCLGLTGCPQPVPALPHVVVEEGWAERWAFPNGESGVIVYVVLENRGGRADRLLGARSDVAPRVGIYRLVETPTGRRWMPVPGGVPLPPGQKKQLTPQEGCLVLFEGTVPFRVGDRFSLALEFERSPTLVVQVSVLR